MRPIRTVPPKDEREYPLVITAEEKDKVLNYILVVANGKRTAKLNYKDIPDLRISKEQYEIVLELYPQKMKGYSLSSFGGTVLIGRIFEKIFILLFI